MHTRDYSEDTSRVIDDEVERILRTQEERAIELLTRHRDGLDKVAQALLEQESIGGGEVGRLVDEAYGRPVHTDGRKARTVQFDVNGSNGAKTNGANGSNGHEPAGALPPGGRVAGAAALRGRAPAAAAVPGPHPAPPAGWPPPSPQGPGWVQGTPPSPQGGQWPLQWPSPPGRWVPPGPPGSAPPRPGPQVPGPQEQPDAPHDGSSSSGQG